MGFRHSRLLRWTPGSMLSTPLLLLATLFVSDEGSAQDPDVPHIREMIQRRIESVEPRSGSPGTRVLVSSTEMPMITPIWIGIGASRTGFEAFQQLMTDMNGTFGVNVEVPAWAQWDRVHTFIAFDLYFRPIALSDVFHVTDEDGLVRRTGHIEEVYIGCLGLEDLDGIRYALRGAMPTTFRPSDRVTVEGHISLEGTCMMPYTIDVVRAERSDPD